MADTLTALPAWTPCQYDAAGAPMADPQGRPRWSGETEPPPIGGRVRVRGNGLGGGAVTGYFVAGTYLGVMVRFDAPPAWYVEKNGSADAPGHVFGAELEAE